MTTPTPAPHDVAIIGGGPAGTTAACILKKHNPALRVLILEKEKFPRDHIGESQLPTIGPILNEMGVWDKVEAAGFPVKVGASYTWGKDHDRWSFDFVPIETLGDLPRPGKFEGQRTQTAFQVDRAVFDDILLRHAESMGVEVREQTQVREILHTADHVDALKLDSGQIVTAKHYLDASGTVSLLRRALDIPAWTPTELKNVAFWDYWENAEWAVEIGTGATRIQIRSLPYGWLWFIPIGPTRTSIGFVAPSEWYKASGESPEDLYRAAIAEQPEIARLTRNATPEGSFQSCRDWSNLADRVAGPNWFLVGESAGFADPILSAGMTLAHTSAHDAAYTILELERAEHDSDWLRGRYDSRIRDGIKNHIRFAQYWYAANSCFTDLKDHCVNIAKEAGIRLTPDKAWRWLSLGGFTNETVGAASLGSFGASHARRLVELFDGEDRKCGSLASGFNVFKLALKHAKRDHVGVLADGRIQRIECYRRADKMLPVAGVFGLMIGWLGQTDDAKTLSEMMALHARNEIGPARATGFVATCWEALEVMVQDGWVMRSTNKKRPMLRLSHDESRTIRTSGAEAAALASTPNAPSVVDRTAPPGNPGE